MNERCSGVLMPISALPSRYGIGDFGTTSFQFAKYLKEGGFKLWQILPLNPLGYGHSPYQPFSSFALDELYMDLSALTLEGLIEEPASFNEGSDKVLYEDVAKYKHGILLEAFSKDTLNLDERLVAFSEMNPWVKSWSLFMTLKRKNGMRSWNEWPLDEQELIKRDAEELSEETKLGMKYETWVQMKLYEQWGKLKAFANDNDIRIIGDVPFYCGFDSCDVWANQDSFLLDEESKAPTSIAGVPPDYFSPDGQRWGNPIYNWELLEKTDFKFLINRLKGNGIIYDIIRLDHFRAFDTFWKIPASCPTAIEGEWIEPPGYKFFDTFKKEASDIEIIAEDLGILRPEVLVLRDHYSFPGMNVIEFNFEQTEFEKKYDKTPVNMVAYIGTHDNDPFMGFFDKLSEEKKQDYERALDELGCEGKDIKEKMIGYCLGLNAKYAIISVQDILGLGSEARLNKPAIIDDVNWTWRLKDFASFEENIPLLREKNKKYNR
ncbi:MAG: 4-alpha-glucanotransferase [Bacilli bacterium]|nr:4-alpha-glucanotransferase [Bacilli bacterium]